jgi:hypothetical protein
MIKLIFTILGAVVLSGCMEQTAKSVESDKAKAAANSIVFTENAEIENIKRRLELTSGVNKIGYIVLLNDAGQPILYTATKGKVTSGGKRLTPEDTVVAGNLVRKAASDEGTYGSSSPYIFFWDTNGRYHQWSGQYLYSDQPIRLRVEPLVIEVK